MRSTAGTAAYKCLKVFLMALKSEPCSLTETPARHRAKCKGKQVVVSACSRRSAAHSPQGLTVVALVCSLYLPAIFSVLMQSLGGPDAMDLSFQEHSTVLGLFLTTADLPSPALIGAVRV